MPPRLRTRATENPSSVPSAPVMSEAAFSPDLVPCPDLPSLVSESSATCAGYTRRFRFGGPPSQAFLQSVATEIEFCVRARGETFPLVTYRGAYPELLFGGGLDLHSLQVWREGWDQRGIRALLREQLQDPEPALELLRHGDPCLVARKRFRLALATADPHTRPGYVAGAAPARFELYHPRSPRVLHPSPYPAGSPPREIVVQAGPWIGEACEEFRYDFATCAAEFSTAPYRLTSEETHG